MLNKVMLIGRLGRDPEIRYLQSGNAVCTFTIATTKRWMKDGQKQEKTEWHKIVTWGKPAENHEKYLSKGSLVFIGGELQTRSYDKDGHTHYTTEINASDVQYLSHAEKQNQPKNSQSQNSYPDDDIPF